MRNLRSVGSTVFAVGMARQIYRRSADGAWSAFTQGVALYRLDGTTVSVVDFGVGDTVPCAHVHANNEVLLSIAGKEVFMTTDGSTWTALPI
jgi:hypothetical protein